jgi:hypothetical protein
MASPSTSMALRANPSAVQNGADDGADLVKFSVPTGVRRRGAAEQPVGLRQSRCDHQRIGNLLRADFHDARGAVERALLLQLDQIVEENVAEAHG